MNLLLLMFVDPCILVQFTKKKIQQDAKMYQNFIVPYLYEAQHVLGNTPPIIRSLKLHWQRSPTTRPTTCYVWKTRGCQCSCRLLMRGGVSPETCWASYKYGIIKFWYIVSSFWIFLFSQSIVYQRDIYAKAFFCIYIWWLYIVANLRWSLKQFFATY
jgi:hypothetical protein